jgi:sialic acid synthase SpsE
MNYHLRFFKQMKFYNKIKKLNRPYIIAEIGSNHNGSLSLAKKLILKAKEAGADCVKFQSWTKDTIFSKKKYKENYFLKDDYRNRKDYTLESIVEKFSLSENLLFQLKIFCNKNKIDFTSTPFSKKEVDFLVNKLKPPFIKIASMDLNNYPFLEYVAQKKKTIVLSTGLSNLKEIKKAVKTIESKKNYKIIILHCVAIYPTPDNLSNINNIDTLKKIFKYPIGYSDHTLGFGVSLAAAAKKICLLEKHFTLNKKMFGWDHKVSVTPDELKIICSETKRITKALGSKSIVVPESKKRKEEFRRSIVLSKDLNIGHKIKETDLDFKRPGTGIPPEKIVNVIGKKIKKNLLKDTILNLKDLRR